ncbi:hypothetical protein KAT51_04090 [bacterium]|nr:hypothetical protein [bacterium]
MKDYIKPAIIGVVILVIALIIIERSCPGSSAKLNRLKGEFKTYKEKIVEDKTALLKEMGKKDEDTIKKDNEIKELKAEISSIDEDRRVLKKKDEEKAQIIYDLKEERETLEDPHLIIANQNLLLEQWEERWCLEREDKNKVIKQRNAWAAVAFKQYGKYLNERHSRKLLEKQLAGQEALTEVGEEIVKDQDKKITGLSLKFTLANVFYTGLGFGLGYITGATR